MIRAVVAALSIIHAAALVAQGSAFADAWTEALVHEAQARHLMQGDALSGYRAEAFTRSEGTVGATRWAPDVTVVVHELLAAFHWERPNDVSIHVRGTRSRSVRLPGVSARDVAGFWTEVFASEPWFAPRHLGDEVEMLGVPERPARHPLAPDGQRWYRYAVADSSTLALPGRTVRAIGIDVTPRAPAPFPLLTGRIWLDADSLDLVRMIGALTGPGLWEDDEDESPVLVGMEVDLEYGLHDGIWWLPARQVVTTHWTYRYLPGANLTGISTTTFANHEIAPDDALVFRTNGDRNSGRWSTWTCDFGGSGLRCGAEGLVHSRHRADGRWEVVIPPLDSVLAYPFDSAFAYHEDLMDEEELTERLIAMSTWSARAPIGRPTLTAADLTPFQVFGFDRVRGMSLGGGALLRLRNAWGLRVAGRGSLHQPLLTGEAGLRREDAQGRLQALGFRHLVPTEPWAHRGGLGPGLKALFFGHDDADWYLAQGGSIAWRGYRGRTANTHLSIAVERHTSAATASGSVLHDVLFGDGDYQENPPVSEGWMVRAAASRGWPDLELGADVLTGAQGLGARAWFDFRRDNVRLIAGTTAGDVLPQQEFRLGGPWTIRGLRYGTRRGRHLWAAQVDWPIAAGPWVSVIPFGDVGGTGAADDPAAGVGLGVADSEGFVRLDFAVGLRPETSARVDLRITIQ